MTLRMKNSIAFCELCPFSIKRSEGQTWQGNTGLFKSEWHNGFRYLLSWQAPDTPISSCCTSTAWLCIHVDQFHQDQWILSGRSQSKESPALVHSSIAVTEYQKLDANKKQSISLMLLELESFGSFVWPHFFSPGRAS